MNSRRIRRPGKPRLSQNQIVRWADAHRRRTGEWPTVLSGRIVHARGETWNAVNASLKGGWRGLPGGGSLRRLLAKRRGVRRWNRRPPLMIGNILRWADAHHRRTGEWPTVRSGRVIDAPKENWLAIQNALYFGFRGLPGGSSLARLLARRRGVRNVADAPRLTAAQILRWADAHRRRTGDWPRLSSGAIADAPGEKWSAIATALYMGHRGLPGGDSVRRLLARRRGVPLKPPSLSFRKILAWADSHHRRTGRWPSLRSGRIVDAPGETWSGINYALICGGRGLPKGGSLARLLDQHRGTRRQPNVARLTTGRILKWADAHLEAHGRWPATNSGGIPGTDGENWRTIDRRLCGGGRGLRGGSSLAKLLFEKRGLPLTNSKVPVSQRWRMWSVRANVLPLTTEQILKWADAHLKAHGRWPAADSGLIPGAVRLNWRTIDRRLRGGGRVPGGSSLAALLFEKRGLPLTNSKVPVSQRRGRRGVRADLRR